MELVQLGRIDLRDRGKATRLQDLDRLVLHYLLGEHGHGHPSAELGQGLGIYRATQAVLNHEPGRSERLSELEQARRFSERTRLGRDQNQHADCDACLPQIWSKIGQERKQACRGVSADIGDGRQGRGRHRGNDGVELGSRRAPAGTLDVLTGGTHGEELHAIVQFEEPLRGVDFDQRRLRHSFGQRAGDDRLADATLVLNHEEDARHGVNPS